MQRLVLDGFPNPRLARLVGPNGRGHHMARYRARAALLLVVAFQVQQQGLQPMAGRVRITYTVVVPKRQRFDPDNWLGGVGKLCADTLVKAGILADDSTAHVEYAPLVVAVERGQRRVIVTLEQGES